MAFAPIILSGNPGTSGTDSYYPVVGNATTGVNGQSLAICETQIFRDTTFAGLFINLTTNTSNNTGTVRFIKNASNGNQSFSVPPTAIGFFQDTTNEDSAVSGDKVAMFFDRGAGGSSTVVAIGVFSDTGDNWATIVGASSNTNIASVASTTTEIVQISLLRSSGIGANGRVPNLVSMTAKNMQSYITTNGRSTTTDFKSGKNGAVANQILSVGAGVTGFFSDTTNTDSYAFSNDREYFTTTGTGTGNFGASFVACEQEYATKVCQLYQMNVVGQGWNSNSPVYTAPCGGFTNTFTESQVQIRLKGTGTIRDFYSRLSANASTGQVDFIVRLNGADTALMTSYAAGVFNTASDTTNIVSFQDGDLLSIKYNRPSGTGASTSRWFTMLLTLDDFVPQVIWF